MENSQRFTADSIFPKDAELRASEVKIADHGRLQLVMKDELLEFPGEWLRMNCNCESCFNPHTLSRNQMLEPMARNSLHLTSVEAVPDGGGVVCSWTDGHSNTFSLQWLYNRRFTDGGIKERRETLHFNKSVPWPAPEEMKVERLTYQQLMETADGFERFGLALIRDGICVITGAPDKNIHEEVGKECGLYLGATHYGDYFQVFNKPSPNNLAYTGGKLELHVDLPFMTNCPKIQYLHCLVPAEDGGENVFSDGIKASRVLRERFPEHYHTLATIKAEYEDLINDDGSEKHPAFMMNSVPVIVLDKDGEPTSIRWNNAVCSSFFNGSADDFEKWLAAMKEFYKIFYELSIQLKSAAGDTIAFDNRRVMHAREPYSTSQERKLEGFYTEWDPIYSGIRLARVRKNQASAQ